MYRDNMINSMLTTKSNSPHESHEFVRDNWGMVDMTRMHFKSVIGRVLSQFYHKHPN